MPEGTPTKKTTTRKRAPKTPKGAKEAPRPVEAAKPAQKATEPPEWATAITQQVGDVANIVSTMAKRLDSQQEQIEALRAGQQQQQQERQAVIIDPSEAQPSVPTERDLAARQHLNAAGVKDEGDITPGFSDNPHIRSAADEYAPEIQGDPSAPQGEIANPAQQPLHETRHLRRPDAFRPPMGMPDPSRHVRRDPNETGQTVRQAMKSAPQMVAVVPIKSEDKVRVGKQWYQLIQGRKMRVPVDVARHFAEKRLIWTGGD